MVSLTFQALNKIERFTENAAINSKTQRKKKYIFKLNFTVLKMFNLDNSNSWITRTFSSPFNLEFTKSDCIMMME